MGRPKGSRKYDAVPGTKEYYRLAKAASRARRTAANVQTNTHTPPVNFAALEARIRAIEIRLNNMQFTPPPPPPPPGNGAKLAHKRPVLGTATFGDQTGALLKEMKDVSALFARIKQEAEGW